jgi:ribosomal protein S27E
VARVTVGVLTARIVVLILLATTIISTASAFSVHRRPPSSSSFLLPSCSTSASTKLVSRLFSERASKKYNCRSCSRLQAKGEGGKQEYRNAATRFLSNFMSNKEEKGTTGSDDDDDDAMAQPKLPAQNKKRNGAVDVVGMINYDAAKCRNLPLATLVQVLDAELYEREWFVTGNVNPVYFSDNFTFQDPDVKLSGIRHYATGVRQLFDQGTARAEIISTVVNPDRGNNTITCTWRLSGRVNIGPGLTIKPYIVYTDLVVDDNDGLVVFQEDRFALPQWCVPAFLYVACLVWMREREKGTQSLLRVCCAGRE